MAKYAVIHFFYVWKALNLQSQGNTRETMFETFARIFNEL